MRVWAATQLWQSRTAVFTLQARRKAPPGGLWPLLTMLQILILNAMSYTRINHLAQTLNVLLLVIPTCDLVAPSEVQPIPPAAL